MANTKVSAFTAASALGGTEVVGGVQSSANAKITIDQIKTYCNTLVSTGDMYWPTLVTGGGTFGASPNANFISYDSDTDRVAWVGRMQLASDTISQVSFRTGTVTTGAIIVITIESVSNGRPNGIIAAGATGSVTVADTDDNVWKTVTIGTPPTITRGLEYAIVMTVDTAGSTPNMALLLGSAATNNYTGQYPVLLLDAGAGTWAVISYPLLWIVKFGTAGVSPVSGMLPVNGNSTLTAINSGSSPNEYAAKLTVPMRCNCVGIRVAIYNVAAGADFTISLWDDTDNPGAAPTPLGQVTEDGDVASNTTQDGYFDVYFTTPVSLSPGQVVYAGVRPDTANSVNVLTHTTATVTNAINAFPVPAGNSVLATRIWVATDPGAWTLTTTTLFEAHLIIDQVIA